MSASSSVANDIDIFSRLPPDVLSNVLRRLSFKDQRALASTGREMRAGSFSINLSPFYNFLITATADPQQEPTTEMYRSIRNAGSSSSHGSSSSSSTCLSIVAERGCGTRFFNSLTTQTRTLGKWTIASSGGGSSSGSRDRRSSRVAVISPPQTFHPTTVSLHCEDHTTMTKMLKQLLPQLKTCETLAMIETQMSRYYPFQVQENFLKDLCVLKPDRLRSFTYSGTYPVNATTLNKISTLTIMKLRFCKVLQGSKFRLPHLTYISLRDLQSDSDPVGCLETFRNQLTRLEYGNNRDCTDEAFIALLPKTLTCVEEVLMPNLSRTNTTLLMNSLIQMPWVSAICTPYSSIVACGPTLRHLRLGNDNICSYQSMSNPSPLPAAPALTHLECVIVHDQTTCKFPLTLTSAHVATGSLEELTRCTALTRLSLRTGEYLYGQHCMPNLRRSWPNLTHLCLAPRFKGKRWNVGSTASTAITLFHQSQVDILMSLVGSPEEQPNQRKITDLTVMQMMCDFNSEKVMQCIARLMLLRNIVLVNMPVSGQQLRALADLPELVSIELIGTSGATEYDVIELQKGALGRAVALKVSINKRLNFEFIDGEPRWL